MPNKKIVEETISTFINDEEYFGKRVLVGTTKIIQTIHFKDLSETDNTFIKKGREAHGLFSAHQILNDLVKLHFGWN